MKIKKIEVHKKRRKDALPDVDVDFETIYRDDVKQYIRDRFGAEFVCSIGSYGTFKLKGAIKDFAKVKGLDFSKVNFITKGVEEKPAVDPVFRDLFISAQKSNELKKFIFEYPDIVHAIKFGLNQTKTASIHASAVVIVPKVRDGKAANIFNWLPLRREAGLLVSEWEGLYTDATGFLKEDILGLNQLDKLHNINILLTKGGIKPVNWTKLRLDNEDVYALFKKGMNEDVFQLNSAGLKAYSIKVKPDNFEEITAMTALYRPGPMGSNAHNDFADFKNKVKKPKFDYGLRSVTEKTQGLYVYQEQIMKSVMVLGGFTAVEAENCRTQIKKFDKAAMEQLGTKFVDGAKLNGCEEEEAWKIWKKLLSFSGYGFNKCLTKNSKVLTSEFKTKNIQDLKKGEILLSYDNKMNKFVLNTVVDLMNNGKKIVYEIELKSGKKIRATENHKFLNSNNKYKTVKKLKVGEQLLSISEHQLKNLIDDKKRSNKKKI